MYSKTAGIIRAVAEMNKAFIFICILGGKMLTLFHQTNISKLRKLAYRDFEIILR